MLRYIVVDLVAVKGRDGVLAIHNPMAPGKPVCHDLHFQLNIII